MDELHELWQEQSPPPKHLQPLSQEQQASLLRRGRWRTWRRNIRLGWFSALGLASLLFWIATLLRRTGEQLHPLLWCQMGLTHGLILGALWLLWRRHIRWLRSQQSPEQPIVGALQRELRSVELDLWELRLVARVSIPLLILLGIAMAYNVQTKRTSWQTLWMQVVFFASIFGAIGISQAWRYWRQLQPQRHHLQQLLDAYPRSPDR